MRIIKDKDYLPYFLECTEYDYIVKKELEDGSSIRMGTHGDRFPACNQIATLKANTMESSGGFKKYFEDYNRLLKKLVFLAEPSEGIFKSRFKNKYGN